ncbi:MAG TPA: PIN domain-containing protein [Armatimonadota bacterium]
MQPSRGTRLVLVASFTLLAGYLGFVLANVIVGWKGYTDTFKYVASDPQTRLALQLVTKVLIVLLGLLLGFFFASRVVRRVVRLGHALEEMPPRDKVAITFGLVMAVVLTLFLALLIFKALPQGALPVLLTLFSAVVVTYLSISATMSMSSELWSLFPSARPDSGKGSAFLQTIKILDTNVIIDGRIADICHTGFLEGTLYVPGFVLDELQHIADSSDALKRARGRRGLDILNEMQKDTGLLVRDFDDVEGVNTSLPVDQKLIVLAKAMSASVVTNDFNLNKVAELQGVKVLNINALANAVKPVVLPGEEMIVQIIKEGKEANQGVGYLEDGTMIVVEGGKRHIGEHLNVVVSSVLQTVAGKMIFTQMRDTDEHAARTDRTQPRRRPV